MGIFAPIPCGETLPVNNIHAVSVSIPFLEDVIEYEEKTPRIKKLITSGYPRFVLHPYLKLLAKFLKKKYAVSQNKEIVLLSSKKAVEIVLKRYSIDQQLEVEEDFGVVLVDRETTHLQDVLTFIQHVGCNLSSRLAEDILLQEKEIFERHNEELEKAEVAKEKILDKLSEAYEIDRDNIALSVSGMNSIYSVIRGLKEVQKSRGRDTLVQFGWLYLDTMNIVKHHCDGSKVIFDTDNIASFKEYLEKNGTRVSGVITEIPNNPLIKTVDLVTLKSLCLKHDIPLIIDTTLATGFNVSFKEYGDIFIESLTKFASGEADVLMGSIIVNPTSKISKHKEKLFQYSDKPYIKDMQRLAFEIVDYKERMVQISANTQKLVEYFENSSLVDKIFWCLSEKSKDNYQKVMRDATSITGLVSITFTKPLKEVYDELNFCKGPSLGTNFTLLMPYTYLAHYDLIQTKKGQEELALNSLPIELVRVSVGAENIGDIIGEFQRVEEKIFNP